MFTLRLPTSLVQPATFAAPRYSQGSGIRPARPILTGTHARTAFNGPVAQQNVSASPKVSEPKASASVASPTLPLFDLIGGEPAVSAVVDRFYDTLLTDARVKDIFAGTDMTRQRAMQKSFVAGVLGGKCYTGKGMKAAHKKLDLTDEHFEAVKEHLETSLKYHEVPEDYVVEIMEKVESTRADVLGRDR